MITTILIIALAIVTPVALVAATLVPLALDVRRGLKEWS